MSYFPLSYNIKFKINEFIPQKITNQSRGRLLKTHSHAIIMRKWIFDDNSDCLSFEFSRYFNFNSNS